MNEKQICYPSDNNSALPLHDYLKNRTIIFLDEPTANLDAIATGQIKK